MSGSSFLPDVVPVEINGVISEVPPSQVAALFPSINTATLGYVTLQAHDDSGRLFAYGSIVDNASGDPVFFAGQ